MSLTLDVPVDEVLRSVLDSDVSLEEAADIIGVSVDVARRELGAEGLVFPDESHAPRVRMLTLAAYLDAERSQDMADAALVRERRGSGRIAGAEVRRAISAAETIE